MTTKVEEQHTCLSVIRGTPIAPRVHLVVELVALGVSPTHSLAVSVCVRESSAIDSGIGISQDHPVATAAAAELSSVAEEEAEERSGCVYT